MDNCIKWNSWTTKFELVSGSVDKTLEKLNMTHDIIFNDPELGINISILSRKEYGPYLIQQYGNFTTFCNSTNCYIQPKEDLICIRIFKNILVLLFKNAVCAFDCDNERSVGLNFRGNNFADILAFFPDPFSFVAMDKDDAVVYFYDGKTKGFVEKDIGPHAMIGRNYTVRMCSPLRAITPHEYAGIICHISQERVYVSRLAYINFELSTYYGKTFNIHGCQILFLDRSVAIVENGLIYMFYLTKDGKNIEVASISGTKKIKEYHASTTITPIRCDWNGHEIKIHDVESCVLRITTEDDKKYVVHNYLRGFDIMEID